MTALLRFVRDALILALALGVPMIPAIVLMLRAK